ncbi:MAG TPA: glycosyltransferase family 4 protein [Gemmataceae bacterium]|nr:glycosyltransferase family 4 protein [Gemmataceae bacterium]
MRVAHFVQRYPPALGGSEAYFARLGRHLADSGDDVTVFTTAALDLEAFWSTRGRCLRPGVRREDGVEVRRYRLCRWPEQRRMLKVLSLLPHRLWQLLTLSCNPVAPGMWRDAGRADLPFDVVHASAFPYGWPLACGLRLARRLGVPFLLTPFLHLGDPDDPRDRTRRAYLQPALLALLRAADRVFVQTNVERDALLAHGIPEGKLVLQGMGVDLADCTGGDRRRARAGWGVGPGEIVIGHLANKSREKGTVDLLRAAERAWRKGHRFRVVLAGPEMANFRTFWKHFGPADRVVRLGVLDARQKRDFFAGLDVFALPSRSDSFGIVFLEAWANGAPNVGYRAGGVAGLIRHEEDGLLVRCGDVDGLADALGRLAGDAGLRRRLGEKGRQRARRDFRWADRLALVRGVYGEVAGCGLVKAR